MFLLSSRLRLLVSVVAVMLTLSGCDGYIEQVRVEADGSVDFSARATVVCGDELQRTLWDEPPCAVIDRASRGESLTELPFNFEFDPGRLGVVSEGEQDRRRIDATWQGSVTELETLLVSGAEVRALDDGQVEATFSPSGAPQDRLTSSDDLAAVVSSAGWPAPEFRVIAPELIVEHNGDDIQGRTVIWTLDGDEPDVFRLVWSTDERGIRVWWWIVGAAILTAVLFMMIVLERPASPKDAGPATT
jgi:hypothetical protein